MALVKGVGLNTAQVGAVDADAAAGSFPQVWWRIVAVVVLAVFITMLSMGMGVLVLPIYAHELGAAGLALGVLFAGFSLSRSLFAPIVGSASDRGSRKAFLVGGLIIYACMSAGNLLATNYLHLIVLRFVSGFGAAMILPVAQARVGDVVPPDAEGRVMSVLNVSIFAGWGTGPIVGGYLRDALGIDAVFLFMTGLLVLALVIVLVYLPSDRSRWRAAPERHASVAPLRTAMGDSMVRALVSVRVGAAWARGSMIGFLPVYGASMLGLTQYEVGLAISLLVLMSGAVQIPAGVIADRADRVRLIVAGMVPSCIAILLLPWAASFGHLLVLAIVLGVSAGLYLAAISAMQVSLGRSLGMGAVMGLASAAMSAGMVCGSLTSGMIMDAWGIHDIFIVNGLVGFAGLSLFLWFASRAPHLSNPHALCSRTFHFCAGGAAQTDGPVDRESIG